MNEVFYLLQNHIFAGIGKVLAKAGENEEWFQITSGNVEGYIKAEFFIYGEDAKDATLDDVQYPRFNNLINGDGNIGLPAVN